MKLCSLCHWLLQSRRWLMLPIGLAASLLLAFWGPAWLWLLISGGLLLIIALLLVYARDLRLLWNSSHCRMPSPADARAELLMVDASLVDAGAQVQAIAQPINPTPEMSLRMGGGALLLGTAMVLLSDELPEADRAAVLAAAAKLNLRKAPLLQRSPILQRGTEEGMTCVTVQDGSEERTYFMADAQTVAAGCSSIWEEHVRFMGQADRTRILDAAAYMATGGRHVIAYATASGAEKPVFLGMAAIGDGLDLEAIQQLSELRSMGMTLILRDDGGRLMDVPSLRKTLDIPDLHARPDLHLTTGEPWHDAHCLSILRTEERSLLQPVQQLKEHFRYMSYMLGRLAETLGLCFLCCLLSGGRLSVPAATAVLAAAYLTFGSLTSARPMRWYAAAAAALCSLLARLLLNAAAPEAAPAAGTCLCIVLCLLASLSLAVPGKKRSITILAPALLMALAAVIIQLLTTLPLMPGIFLPVAFSMVCGGLAGLLFLLLNR